MVNEEMQKQNLPVGNNDFESFKDGATVASNYMKKNLLYVINYSKQPKQVKQFGEWQDKNFVEREGGKAKRTQYVVEVLDLKSGVFSEVTISEKVYMDIIASYTDFAKAVSRSPKLTLFPYIRTA